MATNIIKMKLLLADDGQLFEIRLFDFPETDLNSNDPVSLYKENLYLGMFPTIEKAEEYIGRYTSITIVDTEEIYFASNKISRRQS